MTTTGLYLGKFAPLHKGHQHCIETALDTVDELFVLIYDEPDVTDIPLVTRSEWLRDLYPEVTVLEAWTAPTELGYTDHIKALHEKYVLDKLDGQEIDVFFSSEPYGEHMADALDAVDYRVDEEREEVPISATNIRAAFDEGNTRPIREYVSDRVWRDLVTNVVFLGGPSTGKTTLCKAMSHLWNERWQPEVGREYWEEHADGDGLLSKFHLDRLAKKHVEAEDKALTEAEQYLFTDTNAITTGLFSKWYHGEIYHELEQLMLENISRYDVFILCDDDIPFEPEEGRGGPEGRKRLQRMHESWLDSHGVPYYRVSGDEAERVSQVSEILRDFNKWDSERQS